MSIDGVSVEIHVGDLPSGLALGSVVAVDTETLGLRPGRDPLCLVQLRAVAGPCHLVHFPPDRRGLSGYQAPHLSALLCDPGVTKLFHFGRFDIAVLRHHLGALSRPVYCTKIASKLVRTYTDRHGLKDLCRELLGIEISKEQQSTDWGAAELTDEQVRYAASDVLHLHRLKDRLDSMLDREGRSALAAACFQFLPERALLDLAGWAEEDIFAH